MLAFIGSLILIHAAYSSYEKHRILHIAPGLPHDIILEVFLGLIVLLYGTIQGLKNSERLSVVSAERIDPRESYLAPIQLPTAMIAQKDVEVSEHEWLETRLEMMDIRRKRHDYAEWAKIRS